MANSEADIKLVGMQVKAEAWDFCLDSQDPARRHDATPHRRALVHDYGDGLTINWANDYPGGVTIHGMRNLKVSSDDPRDGQVNIDGRGIVDISAVVQAGRDYETVNASYRGNGISTDHSFHLTAGKNLNLAGSAIHLKSDNEITIEGPLTIKQDQTEIDLVQEIIVLKAEIKALKNKVGSL